MNRAERRTYDDEWAEKLWERYERRRRLPFRRLERAWLEFCDAIAGPFLRWLARRLR